MYYYFELIVWITHLISRHCALPTNGLSCAGHCSQILCSIASKIAILSRNIDQLIALANCNRREQIAILTCWQFVERSRPNVNAKHLIGLFCTSSQSSFIYLWTFEFCSWQFSTITVCKNSNLFASVAICYSNQLCNIAWQYCNVARNGTPDLTVIIFHVWLIDKSL